MIVAKWLRFNPDNHRTIDRKSLIKLKTAKNNNPMIVANALKNYPTKNTAQSLKCFGDSYGTLLGFNQANIERSE